MMLLAPKEYFFARFLKKVNKFEGNDQKRCTYNESETLCE